MRSWEGFGFGRKKRQIRKAIAERRKLRPWIRLSDFLRKEDEHDSTHPITYGAPSVESPGSPPWEGPGAASPEPLRGGSQTRRAHDRRGGGHLPRLLQESHYRGNAQTPAATGGRMRPAGPD